MMKTLPSSGIPFRRRHAANSFFQSSRRLREVPKLKALPAVDARSRVGVGKDSSKEEEERGGLPSLPGSGLVPPPPWILEPPGLYGEGGAERAARAAATAEEEIEEPLGAPTNAGSDANGSAGALGCFLAVIDTGSWCSLSTAPRLLLGPMLPSQLGRGLRRRATPGFGETYSSFVSLLPPPEEEDEVSSFAVSTSRRFLDLDGHGEESEDDVSFAFSAVVAREVATELSTFARSFSRLRALVANASSSAALCSAFLCASA